MSTTSRVGLPHMAAWSAGTEHHTDKLVKVRVLCRDLLAVCARTANALHEKNSVILVPVNERSPCKDQSKPRSTKRWLR